MTSNGVALRRRLPELVAAGLSHLNLSLDTLEAKKYTFLSRRSGFNLAWATIRDAEPLFHPLKLNCVVMRGLNDDEVPAFVELTRDRRLDVRFIEYMPFDGNRWDFRKMVPQKELLSTLEERFGSVEKVEDGPNDTSRAYRVPGFAGQFEFISSMSEAFCGSCNRLRLTADGNLKVCLFGNTEVSLRDALRSGADEAQLTELIASAVLRKKKAHAGTLHLPLSVLLSARSHFL